MPCDGTATVESRQKRGYCLPTPSAPHSATTGAQWEGSERDPDCLAICPNVEALQRTQGKNLSTLPAESGKPPTPNSKTGCLIADIARAYTRPGDCGWSENLSRSLPKRLAAKDSDPSSRWDFNAEPCENSILKTNSDWIAVHVNVPSERVAKAGDSDTADPKVETRTTPVRDAGGSRHVQRAG